MMADFGRLLGRALRRCGRAVRDLNGDLVQASECYRLSARVPPPRSGPMAWVPSLDGYRLTGSHLPGPGQGYHDLRAEFSAHIAGRALPVRTFCEWT